MFKLCLIAVLCLSLCLQIASATQTIQESFLGRIRDDADFVRNYFSNQLENEDDANELRTQLSDDGLTLFLQQLYKSQVESDQ